MNRQGASAADPAEISVVVPVYNSVDILPTLHGRLQVVLTEMGVTFEVV